MFKGPGWNRLAAATGIFFALALGAVGIVGEMKDIELAGDYVKASNEVFGTASILTGFAAVFLFWFSSTLAARLRRLEGPPGRLAAAVNGSGAFIAGTLALGVSVLFAARNYGGSDLAPLASGLFDGPGLLFPAAVYIGAAGVVGVRCDGLPTASRVVSSLSVPLAGVLLAFAGLQIFNNYAWINETGYICFAVWVLVVSAIGVSRWTEDIASPEPVAARAEPRTSRFTDEDDEDDEEEVVAPRPRPRKPAARKSTAKKKAAPRKR